ncbi:MAG: hypothetical protein R3286_13665 [Gammaproteobacteria bacterium]|nr:hypothetical protein [Gammaproteobacteria bacterium]
MEVNEFEQSEGSAAPAYALGIRLTPATSRALAAELREMKEALKAWVSTRGDQAVMIIVTVVSTPDVHEEFDDLLARIYVRERELAPILQKRMLQVALLDPEGNECGQYELTPQA